MEWRKHLFVNRLGDSWRSRSELSESEQQELHLRMVVNYYGFWVNKALHVYVCYKAFKWGMFAAGTTDQLFWRRVVGLNAGVIASVFLVDRLLKNQLFVYCEDLREKYSTGLDEMRLEYLGDKAEKHMAQMGELQRLADMGKQVQTIIDRSRER